ncbi:MAG: hypothetical protein B7X06_00980 [Verrucomicrobia bacterium 21-51-4]|nr:MAG: hypothetical protein B7X06_00980 [Verrucomicrobia bacterium 21-51-4]HQU08576.1 alpha/beta fold hydrolase [Opitutales bacterium]
MLKDAIMNGMPKYLRVLYPFTSKRFQTPDGSMAYLDEGRGDVPLLAVHGNPSWSFLYRNVVMAYQSERRVIVPDHLGMGLSDKPKGVDYSPSAHVERLVALVNFLGLKQFDLMVHDWGGPIGMALAARYPESVRRIVVMNTAAFRMKHMPWSLRVCRIPGLGRLIIQLMHGFAWPAAHVCVVRRMTPEVRDGFLWPYKRPSDREAMYRFVESIPMKPADLEYMALVNIEQGLAKLKNKPMQIHWGMKDFVFTEPFLEKWEQLFPDAHVYRYPWAGHYVLEDAASDVLARVREFLSA